jgi:hypothetical protein
MRDVESLCVEAGLGKLSKSTASRICSELRERFERFTRRDLYGVGLVALFLDAIFLNVRPKGPKEGVLCAWGFSEEGERVLVGVCLGMRESHEDWLSLARDLIARGLGAPMLVVADGAPGLIKAVEQCWPASDRQHCSVHRARNLIAKLPEREREPSGCAGPTGRRSTRPPTSATQRSGSRPWSQSSSGPAMRRPPGASPTISMRSSSTCATRCATASAGARRMKNSRGLGDRHRLESALACGAGVVDPGAKRRIWGLFLPRSCCPV